MKKTLALLLALCALFLCACQNAPKDTPQPTAAPGQDHVFSGVVTDASMSTLRVKQDDGTEITFSTQNAEMQLSGGLLNGIAVSVTYEPPLADGAAALLVTETKAAPSPEPTKKPAPSQAEALLENMTLEEKVGQMFFVRCPAENAASDVGAYHLGGYILFARDFEGKTKSEVTQAISSYQSQAKIPLLIGVDEEGGTVNRISRYKAFRAVPFHSPQALYAEGGFDLIKSDTKEKAELLRSLGINVNFAPVCDVSTNPGDFIYSRTFGKDAAQTAQYVKTVVAQMQESGVGAVLKHFPGYGPNADTHVGFATDSRPYETFTESDFLPFSAGIAAGAQSVLVCHNVVECLDGENPASLSAKWHEALRGELGFSGVVLTDDLVMGAITEAYGANQAAVMAVQAGNDMLLSTEYPLQYAAVLEAVKSGVLSESRIDESVLRILNWKQALGLLS